jgi:hypothetical protein
MPRKSEPFDLFVDWDAPQQQVGFGNMPPFGVPQQSLGVPVGFKARVVSVKVEDADTKLAS